MIFFFYRLRKIFGRMIYHPHLLRSIKRNKCPQRSSTYGFNIPDFVSSTSSQTTDESGLPAVSFSNNKQCIFFCRINTPFNSSFLSLSVLQIKLSSPKWACIYSSCPFSYVESYAANKNLLLPVSESITAIACPKKQKHRKILA